MMHGAPSAAVFRVVAHAVAAAAHSRGVDCGCGDVNNNNQHGRHTQGRKKKKPSTQLL